MYSLHALGNGLGTGCSYLSSYSHQAEHRAKKTRVTIEQLAGVISFRVSMPCSGQFYRLHKLPELLTGIGVMRSAEMGGR